MVTLLADRAVAAARTGTTTAITHQPDEWAPLPHRDRIARSIAAALQVPLCWVTVTDPPRRYRTPQGWRATDFIIVNDTALGTGTGGWRFIPDTDHGHGWLLVDGDVLEVTFRITTLADIARWVDPSGTLWPDTFTCTPVTHHIDCHCERDDVNVTLTAVDGTNDVNPAHLQVTHGSEGAVFLDVMFPQPPRPRQECIALDPAVVDQLLHVLDAALHQRTAPELVGLDTYDRSRVTLRATPSERHPGRVDLELAFASSGRTEHVLMSPEVTNQLGQAMQGAAAHLRTGE